MTRIGFLGDIHYKPATHDRIVSELEALIETFENSVSPDLVVILGDIIHEGGTLAEDRDRANVVQDVVSDLSCPVRYIPGNHDVSNESPNEYWGTVYDQAPWRVDKKQSIGFLDSSGYRLAGPRGELTNTQLQELANAATEWTHGLIFIHHPIHFCNLLENRWFSNTPEEALCGNKQAVWEHLGDEPPIAATINAHLHQGGHSRYLGLDHFTVEAFNKELVPDEAYGSYGVVERDSQLTIRLVTGNGRSETHRLPLP